MRAVGQAEMRQLISTLNVNCITSGAVQAAEGKSAAAPPAKKRVVLKAGV